MDLLIGVSFLYKSMKLSSDMIAFVVANNLLLSLCFSIKVQRLLRRKMIRFQKKTCRDIPKTKVVIIKWKLIPIYDGYKIEINIEKV